MAFWTSQIRMLITAAFLMLAAGPASAEPFIPQDGTQILERLPTRLKGDPRMAESRRLRAALSENPTNVELAIELAWHYVEIGRAEADPRYYGYAQAALEPWWTLPQPAPGILLLRATLSQNRHDFSAALEDLERLLRLQPRNAQAWLTRAVVLQVQGEIEAAIESCLPVRRANPLLAAGCMASTASLGGRAEESYALLSRTLENASLVSLSVASTGPRLRPDVASSPRRAKGVATELWATTTLAKIAERLGHDEAAERHFRDGLALGQRDVYLLGAYADFLLDRGRASEVVALLAGESRADALLLRLALAEVKVGAPEAAAHVETLRARFSEARRRGDGLHLGSESRFRLHLEGDAQEALRLALDNWEEQREPIDARLVLEAALATGDGAAALPVVEFIERIGLEDVRLAVLTRRLQEEITR